MQPSIQVKNQNRDWATIKRARVRDTVKHLNCYWINTTGVNSEPSLNSPNWLFVSSADTGVKDGEFKLAFKGYQNGIANTGANIELNDVCLSIKLSLVTTGAAEFGYYQYVDIAKSDQDPDAYLAITTNDVNAV